MRIKNRNHSAMTGERFFAPTIDNEPLTTDCLFFLKSHMTYYIVAFPDSKIHRYHFGVNEKAPNLNSWQKKWEPGRRPVPKRENTSCLDIISSPCYNRVSLTRQCSPKRGITLLHAIPPFDVSQCVPERDRRHFRQYWMNDRLCVPNAATRE